MRFIFLPSSWGIYDRCNCCMESLRFSTRYCENTRLKFKFSCGAKFASMGALVFLARITPPDFLSFSMLTALNSCYSIPKLSSMHMAISYIVQASNANKPPVTIWSGFHMCANESTAIPRCQILFANTSVVSSYSLTTLLEKYLLNVTGK